MIPKSRASAINGRHRIKSSKTARDERSFQFSRDAFTITSNYRWFLEAEKTKFFVADALDIIPLLLIKIPETDCHICSVNNYQLMAICTNRMEWSWFYQNCIVLTYTNIYMCVRFCGIEINSLNVGIPCVLINYTLAVHTLLITHFRFKSEDIYGRKDQLHHLFLTYISLAFLLLK